jgi:activating signal cointegrator 1
MKVITIWQPWASLVAIGLKAYETRGWTTEYRGELLIHAAKRWSPMFEGVRRRFNDHLRKVGKVQLPDRLPLGAIVAKCEVREIYEARRVKPPTASEDLFGDWTAGRYAWHLVNIQALPQPVPARGQQGMWEADRFLMEMVKAALAA